MGYSREKIPHTTMKRTNTQRDKRKTAIIANLKTTNMNDRRRLKGISDFKKPSAAFTVSKIKLKKKTRPKIKDVNR